MSNAQFRRLLIVLAGILIGYVVVRRRRQLVEALPQPLVEQAERFVIPWTSLERPSDSAPVVEAGAEEAPSADEGAYTDDAAYADDIESADSSRRKVSATYRISYGGRRYGPLPASLVGEYVDIESSNGKLYVLHEGTPIATFDLGS
jgi:hypothetical protein